tara:strand:- start:33 stop:224 length:192 start_codon:yes stop_codon:yes gene_type:complete
MGMTRQERVGLHKKQERTSISSGAPTIGELREGVPVIRRVPGEGLVEFIRDGNAMYKKLLDRI